MKKNTKEMLNADKISFKVNNNWPGKNVFYLGNVELTKNLNSVDESLIITIPYELAPKFDLAQAIDESDYEAFDNIVKQKLEEVINDAVVWFDFAVNEYAEDNINENKLELKIDKIIGNASPEAYKYWDKSLIPGNIEEENVNLAKKYRAEDAKDKILDTFQKIVDENPTFASQIDTSSIQIIGNEPQLIEEELNKLDSLKTKLAYPTIVDMIRANNNWEITDLEAKKTIDELITSKRNIEIAFTIKGEEKNVYVIPIFIPLLVLIPKIRRERDWRSKKPKKKKWGARNFIGQKPNLYKWPQTKKTQETIKIPRWRGWRPDSRKGPHPRFNQKWRKAW